MGRVSRNLDLLRDLLHTRSDQESRLIEDQGRVQSLPTEEVGRALTLVGEMLIVAVTISGEVPGVLSGMPLKVAVDGLKVSHEGGGGKRLMANVSVSFTSGSAKVPLGRVKVNGTDGVAYWSGIGMAT